MPPAGIVAVNIRGPEVLGPRIQIRGPVERAGDRGADTLTQLFNDAVAQLRGPVNLLLAGDELEIQDLAVRWPAFSDPGWLVGTQTNAAALNAAYDAVPDGEELRVLVAPSFQEIAGLAQLWREHSLR